MPHVVWDWNGTLFDDLAVVVSAVNACVRSQGGDEIDLDVYRDRFRRPLNGFYEDLLGVPVDDDLLSELDDVFQEAYWADVHRAGLHSEALEAIRMIEAAGASQSIASMLWHEMLVPAVTGFGIDEYMVAVDGNRGSASDTKEGHMVRHVERLRELFPGTAGSRMTVIGDIDDDARAAAAAGVDCVLYDGGSQRRRDLEACGVPVVESLLDAVALALDDLR